MIHFISLSVFFCLLFGASAQEKKGERHRDEQRKGPPRPEEFLKAYDVNSDKKVSKEEFGTGERASRLSPAIREKIFSRLDKDSDGFISMEELKSMAPKKGSNPLGKADLDKDGRISKDEFSSHGPFVKMPEERREKMFARLDNNSDGFLDQKDGPRRGARKSGRGEKPLLRMKVKGLDADDNGTVSWEEFQKAPAVLSFSEVERRKAFERLDANKDGEISPKELHANFEGRPNHPDKKFRPKR